MSELKELKQCCKICRFSEDIEDFPLDMYKCSWHSYKSEDNSMLCVNKKDLGGDMPKTDIYVLPDFFCNRYRYQVDGR